ncbi:MAG: H4MPT-linked C1 transfer pathway protein [Planctomycetes bacterium]|nr:H4MPT-linked C1 transfer pathway protein [Planctomycetota bacterium]
MSWLGLDIGGANLKAADGLGWARSVPFALWREPAGLADALATLVHSAPAADCLAVTMTGELCDCFRTKAEGVRHILAAVEHVAAGRIIWVYLVNGRFAPVVAAREMPRLAAASNWHALAAFAGRFLEGRSGVLMDVGSTTTDIVPLVDGQPRSKCVIDSERLCDGELVYTGVGRTPICAVTRCLPWRGRMCQVAAELFATTADAYVILGDMVEQPEAAWTADGRPLIREFAHSRLARMICADATEFSNDDVVMAARHVREQQRAILKDSLSRVIGDLRDRLSGFILSGQGEFLARGIVADMFLGCRVVSLAEQLGEQVSVCGPAHALAVLARENGARE